MRIRTILVTAAAPLALGGVLLTATGAHAAVLTSANPNSTITVKDQGEADALMAQGTITKNVDVPAGAEVQLRWVTIEGNVTVEGQLGVAADVIDGNVTVSGPGAGLALFNQASHIEGNLTVTGSSGYDGGNAYGWSLFDNTAYAGPDAATANGTSQVDGGLTFTNNTGALYVDSPLHVAGKLTASGNTQYPTHWDTNGLTVSGKQSVS
jgi:hypothetical protein